MLSCLVAGAAYAPLGTDIKTPTFRSVLDETQLGIIITDSGHKSQLEELLNITGHQAVIIINISELDLSQTKPTLRVRNHLDSTTCFSRLVLPVHQRGSSALTALYKPVARVEMNTFGSRVAMRGSAHRQYLTPRRLKKSLAPWLSVGARVMVQLDYIYDDYSAYLKFLDDTGATAVTLITLVWHEFAHYVVRERRSLPPSLRLISFGGEPAMTNVWKAWRKSVGEYPQAFNAYGTTEATVSSTIWEGHDKIDTPTLPIGRAHTGHTCYVLDPVSKLPVVPGEDGILFVSGPGIAIGYLDKALTQKRFVPNPWAQSAIYERMYDTGDVVCQDEEGLFWFKGRLDLRVKVQGGRVELPGIETCLLGHPRVLHAAVIAVPDQNTHFLHAYIVEARSSDEKPLYVEDMMEYCRTRLEYWETPRRFFKLERLPHTASQKVDRQLLRSLEPESLPVRLSN